MRCPGHKRLRAGAFAALSALLAGLALAGVSSAAPNPEIKPFSVGYGTRVTGLTTDRTGNFWFAGFNVNGTPADLVGNFAPSGQSISFQLPFRSVPQGGKIAAGPDGRLWFTDPATNQVGAVNAAGEIEEYPLPSGNAGPGEIVSGPGDAMWFVEENVNKVGRVQMNGAVSEASLPAGANPTGIVAGSDGALWIVEKGLGKIARMTANGVVTDSYVLPDPDSRPHAIVHGPGGDLWFSEEDGPRIGRINAAGAITEYPIPGENGTRELALGGDGNLWFTTGSAIGSIAADGATGEPECITAACSYPINALAKGPEGDVWFATDIQYLGAGGGTNAPAYQAGGLVGRFHAPELRVRLGRRATRVNDGLTTVSISCHGGSADEACRGWLRLTAKLRGRRVLLDRHRYRLQPATSRRLPLRVGARGKRALARAKRIKVQVSASLIEASGVRRGFVLQARGRR